MICPKCRDGKCGDCVDNKRRKDAAGGKIPGYSGGCEWCYCGHVPRQVPVETPGDPTDC